ncbi:MAG: pilus assembly protein N-terminal domain-containing protein [Gemmataceae bacterium]
MPVVAQDLPSLKKDTSPSPILPAKVPLYTGSGITPGFTGVAPPGAAAPGATGIKPAVAAQEEKMPMKVPAPEVEGPPPKEFMPFGPKRPRLPRLPGVPGPLGSTPIPSKEELKDFGRYVEKFIDPRNTLDLVVNRPRLMVLKEAPKRVQMADESVANYNLITPREITILGRQVGTTVMNMWFTDPDDKKDKVLSYLVRVIPDPEAKERLDRIYDALAAEINRLFPNSVIHLKLVGDKLIVTGEVHDIFEGTHILRIIRANAPPTDQTRIPVDNVQLIVRPDDINAPGGLPGLENFLIAGGPNVVNLLRVPGEQQVMLKVTVAEVNRAAARSIGLNFSITNNQGITVFQNNTGQIAAGPIANALGGVTANLPVLIDNGQISLAIHALKELHYARTLAEPNLVALNGQTATFQSGGQFPVPVVTGATATGLQGVQFVPFGVQLQFTPFITDRDRVRLTVSANVSTRNIGTGATFQGTNVPGLDTRNFTSVVELREGQTLAVAGLLQTNMGGDSFRVPFIGDLPFLGQLTGSTKVSAGEQELVILVTPELVHPMERHEVPPLPGSDLFEPSDLEFYVVGRMEGRRRYDYRSPAMTDLARMRRFYRCEQIYIFGPHGHSMDVPLPDGPIGGGFSSSEEPETGPTPLRSSLAPGSLPATSPRSGGFSSR